MKKWEFWSDFYLLYTFFSLFGFVFTENGLKEKKIFKMNKL